MATAIRELDSVEEWLQEWGDLTNEVKTFKVRSHLTRLLKVK